MDIRLRKNATTTPRIRRNHSHRCSGADVILSRIAHATSSTDRPDTEPGNGGG